MSQKVASLILAGGQGSRLGWPGPKALFPICPQTGATLLELLLKQGPVDAPRAMIVSPEGRGPIERFLQQRGDLPHVQLCQQEERPLYSDQEERPLHSEESRPLSLKGPDGNGSALHLLARDGLLEKWRQQRVELITVVPIDNPLARPFDPAWIEFHQMQQAEVSLCAVARASEERTAGVLAHRDGKLVVIEYTDIPEEEWGNYPLIHTGMIAFSLPFAERVAALPLDTIPWHYAKKKYMIDGEETSLLKAERYLFDWLPHSRSTAIFEVPRLSRFAPLKGGHGPSGIKEVQSRLQGLFHS